MGARRRRRRDASADPGEEQLGDAEVEGDADPDLAGGEPAQGLEAGRGRQGRVGPHQHEHPVSNEEVGLEAAPGPWVWSRTATFRFRGIWLEQHERWFLVRTAGLDADTVPLDDLATAGARWWSLDELRTTDAVLAPAALPVHLATLLHDGPPERPVDVGA